jgi:DNA-binding MarR family transcriptional regulator
MRPVSKGLRTFNQAINLFRDLDPEMQAQTMSVFITIASAAEDISMQEIITATGLASSSVSRNVAALSKVHRLGKDGHNLVEAYEDPAERRRKLVRLTPTGRTFTTRLQTIMG